MLAVSVATQDGRFITLYLESDWKVSRLREMIKDQLNIPIVNQQLLLDGKQIGQDDKTLAETNIKTGDVVYVVYIPGTTASQHAVVSNPPLGESTENFLRQKAITMMDSFLPGSNELEAIRETSPEVYEAILTGDVEKVVSALRNMHAAGIQRLRERQMRLLQAQLNPLNPDSQRIIQEAIADSRINENLANAQNYLPESFGNIVMLYINVDINRVTMQALVDTGAQNTIMSKECAQKCNLMNMVDSRYQGIAVGVSTGKIIGKIHLANMKIGKTYIPFSVVIIDSIHIDFILGLDLLRRHQCSINLMDNTLQICGETVQFLAEREIQKPLRLTGRHAGASQSHTSTITARNIGEQASSSSSSRQGIAASSSYKDNTVSQDNVKTLCETLGISQEQAQALLDATDGDIEFAASLHYQQQYD